MKTKTYLTVVLFCALAANAQLTVTVASSKVSGQKALVPLAMKNSLTETVQSARAVVFILDDQGKVTGQATRWVIGGPKAPDGLSPGATNSFQFVVTSNKLIPPNATATKPSRSTERG